MGIIEDYGIDRKIETCSACGKQFAEGEQLVSGLYESDGGFARKDFCLACWNDAIERDCLGHWRTKNAAEGQRRRFVDDDVIFSFFEKLTAGADESTADFRYVLALMLMRKRWLKLDRVERDGEKVHMVLRCPRRDASYKVEERHLSPEEMEKLNDEVAKLFAMPME